MSRASPTIRDNSREWDKYQLGFIWEEIRLFSLGERLEVLERVHLSESERAMQNIWPG